MSLRDHKILRVVRSNKVVNNASWIIACRIVQAILTLIVGMITARYLGPSNYGLINYAASVVAFFVPVMQLGLNDILVQELVNEPEKEGEIMGTSLLLSQISSVACLVGIMAFVSIANAGEPITVIVCLLYSINLFFQGLELIQYWFQANYLSKYTSVVSLIAYAVVSAYKIYLLIARKSVYWFAVSYAIDYMVISLTLIAIYRKKGRGRFTFSRERAKKLLSSGKHYISANLMVTVFAQTDRVMLKLMINDAATGYYTAATSCVGITALVYAAIIDSARPSIFENVKLGKEQFEKSISRLYCVITYVCLCQCVVMTALAPFIITLLYGADYAPAISALQIVVWFSTFSYYGVVRNIWILAMNEQRQLWKINLCGALANVTLNYFLIPVMGVNGAALASLITQIFTNVIVGYLMKPIRRNNYLMVKGLNPKLMIEWFRNL